MKNLVFAAMLLLGFCAMSVAQDVPKFEVFEGWTTILPEESVDQDYINGWNASLVINANQYAGIAIDISGVYSGDDNPNSIHTFLFGPHVAFRKHETFTPFVHALFGAAHMDASSNIDNDNGLAMAFGGGVDIKINKSVSFRPVQADFMTIRSDGSFYNFARLSTGIVIKIGTF